MRNLIAKLSISFAMLTAAAAAGPAHADVTCRPGSLTPGCLTQGAVQQNAALSALACQLQPSMPGCTTQTPTTQTPAPVPPAVTALTASFHGLPDAHDGKKLFTFEIRFSQEFEGLRPAMLKRALEVTGGKLVGVKRTVRGQNRSMTVKVRPSSSGDVTVALPAVGWLWGAASTTVSGPPTPSVLSASFHGLPDAHNGNRLFSFEIRFSEEFDGLRLTALKEALEVTGGRLIDVKRTVRGQNRSVTVRVRPASHAPVTVTLGATENCSAAGAICTKDGRMLSGSSSARVTSLAWGSPIPTPVSAEYLRSLSENLPRLPKNVGKTVSSSAPDGFPSGDPGTVVNMNHMGSSWTGKANLQVRERRVRGGHIVVAFPCRVGGERLALDADGWCMLGDTGGFASRRQVADWAVDLATWEATPPADRSTNPPKDPRIDGGISVYGGWFTYPHNAGTNDMKVHLEVLRGAFTEGGKLPLIRFFLRGHDIYYFYNHLDFFKANAHLEAPGTAVQPTGADNTTATWSGKVIALDTARYGDALKNSNLAARGQLIGGDANVSVRFTGGNAAANVQLTNLKGTNVAFSSYPDLAWAFLAVNNGSFSRTVASSSSSLPNSTISGTFRGTNAAKVGGTFEIPNHHGGNGRWLGMVGGFVADKD